MKSIRVLLFDISPIMSKIKCKLSISVPAFLLGWVFSLTDLEKDFFFSSVLNTLENELCLGDMSCKKLGGLFVCLSFNGGKGLAEP